MEIEKCTVLEGHRLLVARRGGSGIVRCREQYGQQLNNERIHETEIGLEREYGAQNGWIITLMNHEMLTGLAVIQSNLVSLASPGRSELQNMSRFTSAFQAYTNLQMAMNNDRPYNAHHERFNSAIKEITSSVKDGSAIGAEARQLLKRAIPDEDELDRLRADSSPSLFHKLLVYFSPFLLAIALSLQITRVTAEVYVL